MQVKTIEMCYMLHDSVLICFVSVKSVSWNLYCRPVLASHTNLPLWQRKN